MFITTPEGTIQYLRVLPQPISAKVTLSPTAFLPEEKVLEEHRSRYNSKILLPKWSEIVLAFTGNPLEIDITNSHVVQTTSYMAQAVRQRLPDAELIHPITIEGIIRSADNKIILSVRQGFVQNGKISAIPLGYLSNNFIARQFYQESEEEIGIKTKEYSGLAIIGYQTDPEFTRGINLVLQAQSQLPAEEILKRHRTSLGIALAAQTRELEQSGDKGKARVTGKKAIHDAGYTNIDAADNHPLVLVENNFESIDRIVSDQHLEVEGQRYPLMGTCQGGLTIYLDHIKH